MFFGFFKIILFYMFINNINSENTIKWIIFFLAVSRIISNRKVNQINNLTYKSKYICLHLMGFVDCLFLKFIFSFLHYVTVVHCSPLNLGSLLLMYACKPNTFNIYTGKGLNWLNRKWTLNLSDSNENREYSYFLSLITSEIRF